MSDYAGTPTWVDNIYLLETTDKVLGGVAGEANIAHKNSADRTATIKAKLDAAGIFVDPLEHAYIGQQYLDNVTFSGAVDGDVVYQNSNGQVYPLLDTGFGTATPLGIADVTNSRVITNGVIAGIPNISGYSEGDMLYVSTVTAGKVTTNISTVSVGLVVDAANGVVVVQLVGATELPQGMNADTLDGLHAAQLAEATTGNPVGTIIQIARTGAPEGYLKCNGAAISRTTYANLFAIISTIYGNGNGSTTFNLPDFRGEFIRGLDDGRGIDPGRALSEFENHQLQYHSHYVQRKYHNMSLNDIGTYDITNSDSGFINTEIDGASGTFGSETRPRNMALLYCIKY